MTEADRVLIAQARADEAAAAAYAQTLEYELDDEADDAPAAPPPDICAFCGKSRKEVRDLIAGPTARICDGCVSLCGEIIEEKFPKKSAPKAARANIPFDFTADQEALRNIQHEKDTCTVYFVQSGHGGDIKIGLTKNLDERMKGLQGANPVKLVLIGAIPKTAMDTEAQLHARFAAHRTIGEWFRPDPEILAFIESLKQPAAETVS